MDGAAKSIGRILIVHNATSADHYIRFRGFNRSLPLRFSVGDDSIPGDHTGARRRRVYSCRPFDCDSPPIGRLDCNGRRRTSWNRFDMDRSIASIHCSAVRAYRAFRSWSDHLACGPKAAAGAELCGFFCGCASRGCFGMGYQRSPAIPALRAGRCRTPRDGVFLGLMFAPPRA